MAAATDDTMTPAMTRETIAGLLDQYEPRIAALRDEITAARTARQELQDRRRAGDATVDKIAADLAEQLGVRPRRVGRLGGVRALLSRLRTPSSAPSYLEPAVLDKLESELCAALTVDETRLQQAEATVTRLRAWDAGLEMADVALGIAADLEAIRSKAATLNSMAESYGRRFYGMQDIPAVPRPLVSRATLREIYPTLTSVIGLETERAIGMPERVLAMMDLARLGLDMGAYLAEMDRDQVRVGPVLAVQNRVHHEIKSAAEALNDALRQQVQEVAA